eukprot:TRINITY_DN24206_c0_g1_i1.p1 TRINITY_DN24206_c0_g1~~TRINITY_DN24206_c0_g1_i1.p1  ORF type:complete len:323 (-),score=70.41 TRINITY_DN24206_c0_g1_i1:897-1865(-)
MDRIGFSLVEEAALRILPYVHRTPVLTSTILNKIFGYSLFFKCENFQKVGAFKSRGACNAVFSLSEEEAACGVATHSSGNHAQALARAASLRGIQAHIIMPSSAPVVKRSAVEGYGAKVYTCEPNLKSRESTADAVCKETGATFIHPYDRPDIICGQGTAVKELIEDVPDLDAIIVPCGGGGLLSGSLVSAKHMNHRIKVFGCEPKGADDARRSLDAGHFIPQEHPVTIADGLLTSLGGYTWPIIRDNVENILTVPDHDIIRAMHYMWERMKIVVEPSAATSLASVWSQEFKCCQGIKRVGVVLSGGNIDLRKVSDLFSQID